MVLEVSDEFLRLIEELPVCVPVRYFNDYGILFRINPITGENEYDCTNFTESCLRLFTTTGEMIIVPDYREQPWRSLYVANLCEFEFVKINRPISMVYCQYRKHIDGCPAYAKEWSDLVRFKNDMPVLFHTSDKVICRNDIVFLGTHKGELGRGFYCCCDITGAIQVWAAQRNPRTWSYSKFVNCFTFDCFPRLDCGSMFTDSVLHGQVRVTEETRNYLHDWCTVPIDDAVNYIMENTVSLKEAFSCIEHIEISDC